jgi:hypothetical protein
MKDNNYSGKTKTLEKLIIGGFDDEEKIKNMKLDDIFQIKDITPIDIQNIRELREAIRVRKIIAFFSGKKN